MLPKAVGSRWCSKFRDRKKPSKISFLMLHTPSSVIGRFDFSTRDVCMQKLLRETNPAGWNSVYNVKTVHEESFYFQIKAISSGTLWAEKKQDKTLQRWYCFYHKTNDDIQRRTTNRSWYTFYMLAVFVIEGSEYRVHASWQLPSKKRFAISWFWTQKWKFWVSLYNALGNW